MRHVLFVATLQISPEKTLETERLATIHFVISHIHPLPRRFVFTKHLNVKVKTPQYRPLNLSTDSSILLNETLFATNKNRREESVLRVKSLGVETHELQDKKTKLGVNLIEEALSRTESPGLCRLSAMDSTRLALVPPTV